MALRRSLRLCSIPALAGSCLVVASLGLGCGAPEDEESATTSASADGGMDTVTAGESGAETSGAETGADTGADTGSGPTCESSCPNVLEAGCAGGPVDLADCESGCAYSQMTCPEQMAAVFDCLPADPVFSCDASGRVVGNGCDAQYEALYACLGVP